MLVTVEQFIDAFRSDVFDRADVDDDGNARDTLWSDADILRYINKAATRWATDTHALRRRFVIEFAADQATAAFPYDFILDDLTVSFSIPGLGRRRTLRKFDIDEGVCRDDYGNTYVEHIDLDASGQPSHFTRDYDDRLIRLYPIPHIAGVLNASAIVTPQQIYPGMPLPASNQIDLDLIMMWVKKEAYAKQDADTLDLARSQAFEAEYKRYVLDRRSDIDRTRRDAGLMKSNV